ncbi:hypothetical protein MTO96_048918 [Rhipicephalus appendiculatus]
MSSGFLVGGDSGPSALAALFFLGIGPRVVVLCLDTVPGVLFMDSKDLSRDFPLLLDWLRLVLDLGRCPLGGDVGAGANAFASSAF